MSYSAISTAVLTSSGQLRQMITISSLSVGTSSRCQRSSLIQQLTKKGQTLLTSFLRHPGMSTRLCRHKVYPGMTWCMMDPDASRVEVADTPSNLCFLLVCDAFNSMAQRAWLKLQETGHRVVVHLFKDGKTMVESVELHKPDIILCPYLTERIPAALYNGKVPCLIIHPGIEGDRGMSSIDWALQESAEEWGVTILQAAEKMDAGPIWATTNFKIDRRLGGPPTKSSLYRVECIDAAMECIDEVLHKLKHNIVPRPLNYSDPNVRGKLRPRMKQSDRQLDWRLPAIELARIIRASDSQPGTLSIVGDDKYLLFGAHVDQQHPRGLPPYPPPMELLGWRDGAVLIACGEGTVLWLTHLKKSFKSIKVPAMMALPIAASATSFS